MGPVLPWLTRPQIVVGGGGLQIRNTREFKEFKMSVGSPQISICGELTGIFPGA